MSSAATAFSQSFFHGTRADLKPGDLIVVGYQSNFTDVEPLSWVYFAATLDAAIWGAELAVGNGRERIYVVEPSGPIMNDPNLTDKKFPGNPTLSYRSRDPVRVIAEVTMWRAGHRDQALRAIRAVGAYDPARPSNIGIGHGAVDGGVGYTYFDPKTGHEISGVLGFTYNTINPDTQYQNGVDMHFDWGASQFLTKQFQVGVVGYVYNEIGCDSGSGDRVGCFQSRVVGVGPQIGYIIPLGAMQAYVNVKGYKEFDAENRPHGWNAWLTVQLAPAPPGPAPPPSRTRNMYTK